MAVMEGVEYGEIRGGGVWRDEVGGVRHEGGRSGVMEGSGRVWCDARGATVIGSRISSPRFRWWPSYS